MLSSLRNRFGIPGVISVIALVFAMLGGAYAATNKSGAGKATASAKAKQGSRGPRGKTGPAGPAGPQGPAGALGAKGDKGDAGANGTNGTNGAPGAPGANGNSVTVSEIEPEQVECNELGGAEVKVVGDPSGVEVCNGANGAQGSPWTAGGTLPPGSTETGGWSFRADKEADPEVFLPISFTIPLAQKIPAAHAHYIPAGGSNPVCPGSVESPAAKPGELCFFATAAEGVAQPPYMADLGFSEGAGISGATMVFTVTGAANPVGLGSWAVTGCSSTPGDPNECPA
jgi:collagen triple helix repeat protein